MGSTHEDLQRQRGRRVPQREEGSGRPGEARISSYGSNHDQSKRQIQVRGHGAVLHCLAVVAQKLCQAVPNIKVVRCTEQRAPHVVCTRHFPIHGGQVVAGIRMCHVECKRARAESEALSNRGVGTTWVRHGGPETDVPVRVRSVPAHHGTETRVTKQIETQCANAIGRPFHFSIRLFSIKRSAGSN